MWFSCFISLVHFIINSRGVQSTGRVNPGEASGGEDKNEGKVVGRKDQGRGGTRPYPRQVGTHSTASLISFRASPVPQSPVHWRSWIRPWNGQSSESLTKSLR